MRAKQPKLKDYPKRVYESEDRQVDNSILKISDYSKLNVHNFVLAYHDSSDSLENELEFVRPKHTGSTNELAVDYTKILRELRVIANSIKDPEFLINKNTQHTYMEYTTRITEYSTTIEVCKILSELAPSRGLLYQQSYLITGFINLYSYCEFTIN